MKHTKMKGKRILLCFVGATVCNCAFVWASPDRFSLGAKIFDSKDDKKYFNQMNWNDVWWQERFQNWKWNLTTCSLTLVSSIVCVGENGGQIVTSWSGLQRLPIYLSVPWVSGNMWPTLLHGKGVMMAWQRFVGIWNDGWDGGEVISWALAMLCWCQCVSNGNE